MRLVFPDEPWRAEQAFGQADVGGVMDYPLVPDAGLESWAQMSSMQPGHPLVGGSAGAPGYGGGQRQVVVGAPAPTQPVASGSPTASHWSELFNFKGNPIGWVAIAAVLFLGLMHIHVRGGADVGVGRKGR
jgi:hypothetical protein